MNQTAQDTYNVGYAPARANAKQFWQVLPTNNGTLTLLDGTIALVSTSKNKDPQTIFNIPVSDIKKATFAPTRGAVYLSLRTTTAGDYTIQFSSGWAYRREAVGLYKKLKNLGVPSTNLVPNPILSVIIIIIAIPIVLIFKLKQG